MSDEKHTVVIRDGEMIPADDSALSLEVDAPVEEAAAVPLPADSDDTVMPPRPPEPARVGPSEAAGFRPPSPEEEAPVPPRSAELVAYEAPLDPTGMTLTQIGKLGRVFTQSGFFKDSRDANQAVTKIVAGQELGIGPMQSMLQFHIVDGKPTMGAGLIAALVKRSGRYDYRVAEHDDEHCVLDWYEGEEMVGQSAFSIDEAKRAGIYRNGSGWTKYPSDMVFARAISRGARRYAPDVVGGAIYATGEIES